MGLGEKRNGPRVCTITMPLCATYLLFLPTLGQSVNIRRQYLEGKGVGGWVDLPLTPAGFTDVFTLKGNMIV